MQEAFVVIIKQNRKYLFSQILLVEYYLYDLDGFLLFFQN